MRQNLGRLYAFDSASRAQIIGNSLRGFVRSRRDGRYVSGVVPSDLALDIAQMLPIIQNAQRANEAAEPASLPQLIQQGGADLLSALSCRADAPLTVRQIVNLYLDLEGPELCASSLRERKRYVEAFAEKFGNYPIDQLHKSDLRAWLRTRDGWKSDHTRCNAVRSIKRLFQWAEDDERIPRNPFRRFNYAEGPCGRAMTEEEFAACLRHTDAVFRRVLFFLRYCGCRPGELVSLEWPMIDWARSVAVLEKHKTSRKTRKPRVIYLVPLLIRLLRWCERNRIPDQRAVFINTKGDPWSGGWLSIRLQRLREVAGLAKDCKLYGLRHKLATDSQVAGNSLAVTAELLGHDDPRTTAKYYTHLRQHEEFLLGAIEKAGRAK